MVGEEEKIFPFRSERLVDGDGILVATDKKFEFLLPFWWTRLRKFNRLPVTFIDLGMSEEAHLWCKERGEVLKLTLPDSFFEKRKIDNVPEELEKRRRSQFMKPFAMLLSPYQRTLWLDVDCEIRGNLAPLFPFAGNPAGMALAHGSEKKHLYRIKRGFIKQGEFAFNSGVIVFLRNCQIIKLWAHAVCDYDGNYIGDQDILTRVIYDHNFPVSILPKKYNWRVLEWGINKKALIVHWNSYSKKIVMNYIKMQPELSQFYPK